MIKLIDVNLATTLQLADEVRRVSSLSLAIVGSGMGLCIITAREQSQAKGDL